MTTTFVDNIEKIVRDYAIIVPNPKMVDAEGEVYYKGYNPTDIDTYYILAIRFEKITHILNYIKRKYSSPPFIEYLQSNLDPVTVIDSVYMFNTGKPRTLYMKSKSISEISNISSGPRQLEIDPIIYEVLIAVYSNQYVGQVDRVFLIRLINSIAS